MKKKKNTNTKFHKKKNTQTHSKTVYDARRYESTSFINICANHFGSTFKMMSQGKRIIDTKKE